MSIGGPCGAPPNQIMISPQSFVSDLVCAWDSTATRWNTLRIEQFRGPGAWADQINMTLTDSIGTPLSVEWTNLPVPFDVTMDISWVPFDQNPNLLFTFGGVVGTIEGLDVTVTFEGHPPQVCLWWTAKNTQTPTFNCTNSLNFAPSLSQDMTVPAVYTYNSTFKNITIKAKKPVANTCPLNYTTVQDPGAVQSLTVTNKATSSITVSFQAPASDGGLPILWYEYSITSGASWGILVDATVVSTTWSGTIAGPAAIVWVRAVNFAGPGNHVAA